MRYTGPKWRINRREGTQVLGSNDKWKRRPGNPGQHPFSRGRASDYAIQFREKQKVKRTYGMTEKQFKRFYAQAQKATGNTGTRLLQLLEMRLDSVVLNLGFATTRAQARQFVSHGHVQVNGKKLDVPSYIVKVGDEITLKESILSSLVLKEAVQKNKAQKVPTWLSSLKNGGKVIAEPTRDEIDQSIKEQRIIELYSRN